MEALQKNNYNKPAAIAALLRLIRSGIAALFEPEEVEVNYRIKGKKIIYTFTKVDHKQVA